MDQRIKNLIENQRNLRKLESTTLQNNFNEYSEKLNNIENRVKELEPLLTINEKVTKLEDKAKDLELLNSNINNLKYELNQIAEIISNNEDVPDEDEEFLELKSFIDNINTDLTNINKKISSLVEMQIGSNNRVENLETLQTKISNSSIFQDVENINSNYESLKNTIETSNNLLNELISKTTNQLFVLAGKTNNINVDLIDRINKLNENLTLKLSTISSNNEKINQQILPLNNIVNNLSNKLESLNNNLSELSSNSSNQNNKIEKVNDILRMLSEEKEKINNTIDEIKVSIENIMNSNDTQNFKNELENKFETLSSNISLFITNIQNNLNEKLQTLSNTILTIQNKIDNIDLESINISIDNIKSSMEVFHDQINKNTIGVTTLEGMINQYNQDFKEYMLAINNKIITLSTRLSTIENNSNVTDQNEKFLELKNLFLSLESNLNEKIKNLKTNDNYDVLLEQINEIKTQLNSPDLNSVPTSKISGQSTFDSLVLNGTISTKKGTYTLDVKGDSNFDGKINGLAIDELGRFPKLVKVIDVNNGTLVSFQYNGMINRIKILLEGTFEVPLSVTDGYLYSHIANKVNILPGSNSIGITFNSVGTLSYLTSGAYHVYIY